MLLKLHPLGGSCQLFQILQSVFGELNFIVVKQFLYFFLKKSRNTITNISALKKNAELQSLWWG